jgi:hypothetical protein
MHAAFCPRRVSDFFFAALKKRALSRVKSAIDTIFFHCTVCVVKGRPERIPGGNLSPLR